LNKILIFILLSSVIIVYGCASFSELTGFSASKITFNQGVKKINELDEKYGADLKTAPSTTEEKQKI